jgi:hypothetical protein
MFIIMRFTITNIVVALATACLVQGCATDSSDDDQADSPAATASEKLSLQAGGFASTCRRMRLSGTVLSAECKNLRGDWFRGPDLNLAQHIGNKNGQLADHSANYQNTCGNCKLGSLGCLWVPKPDGTPFWQCDYNYGKGCWDQGSSPFYVKTYCLLACEKVDNNTGCRRNNGNRLTTSYSLEACIANYAGTLNWVCN